MKNIILPFLLLCSLGISAQSYNMIRNGQDTAFDCSGTLYDHGGPSGGYFNNSNDNFYIFPSGGSSVDVTFTYFNTEGCCDRVRIYDQATNTLIGNYGGSGLPNGGSPINIPSGQVRVRFQSDYSVTRGGFALNWTSSGTTAPTASFTTNTSTPALNQIVQFNNTSVGGGTSFWLFGDGDSSVASNPVHAYSSPGTYNISLIQSNCYGVDTITGSVTVQAASVFTYSPDTLAGTALCGSIYLDTLQFQYQSGGATYYDINVSSLTDQTFLEANFETSLSPLVRSASASTSFGSSVVLGGAGQGNAYLQLSGYAALEYGVYANFNAPDANYYSMQVYSSSSTRSYLRLADEVNGSRLTVVGLEAYYGNLRVYGSSTQTVPLPSGSWNTVELRDIDYQNQSFDVYLNGSLVMQNMGFSNWQANEIERIDIANYNSSANVGYDEILLQKIGDISAVTVADTNGVTNGTVDIPIAVDLSGSLVGLQQYLLEVRTSANTADSLLSIPLNVTVSGQPIFTASKSCLNYDTSYIGLAQLDSVQIFNDGCDSLDLNSLSTTNSEFSVLQSSLVLAPGDSGFVFVRYLPSTTGLIQDTLFFNGNLDTSLCLSAEAFTAPAIAFDSTTYTVNSYGCNDSVPMQFYLYNQGSGASLNWNLSAGNSIFDDFENGFDAAIWSTHGSNTIFDGCYERSGTNALSMTGTQRWAETVMLSLNQGDSVSMWAFPGNNGGTACENPDNGEDVFVQYRLSGSFQWITIGTIYNYNTSAQRYSFSIPVTGQMQVRLYQQSHSGSGFDHYRIDDFEISSLSSATSFSPTSGTTVSGDSVLISGYLSTAGLLSGNYSRYLVVQSNDPAHPDTTVSINLNIFGQPDLVASSSCLNYDTVLTGATVIDSVYIINTGCADLDLTSYSLGGSQFSHSLAAMTIAPEDTAWLAVSFNPTVSQLGLVNDTLTVLNNDTIWKLCLSGYALGAPIASLHPDSLSVTVTNCGDSLSIPVYLRNTGLSNLDYKYVDGGRSGTKINVAVMQTSTYYTERLNMYNAISQMNNVNLAYINPFNAAGVTQDLDTMDVLILPEGSSSSTASQFAPAYQAFLNDGGVVIMGWMSVFMSTSLNIMPISQSGYPGSTIAISIPNHPVAAGLPSSGLSYLSATQLATYVNTTNLTRILGAVGTDQGVVAAQPYGDGMAIHIGYDYWQTNNDVDQLLRNAVNWGASQTGAPGFISASPDSGLVAAGDSVLINIGINTAGISNGTYDYDLFFETNDPANNPLRLPLHLVINGSAKAEVVDSACIAFGSALQGASLRDTFAIYNKGCDTLEITSYTGSNADFSIDNLPMQVVPGDTAKLSVLFSPFGVGLSTDTLVVSTNDTSVAICVSGTGLGAALPSIVGDTITYTLQKCKVVGNKQIKIKNIGQGSMNFDIEFGRTSQSSQIAYNTAGANTIHSFNQLPTSADSIKLRIILHGDYDSYWERSTLYLDGSYWMVLYDNNHYYQNDTLIVNIVGTQVATLLADGNLDVGLYNSSSVDGGAGSFHRVELEVVQSVNWVSVVGANSGTIPATDSVTRNLLFNAAILPVGTHYTTMILNNNSPSQPDYRKPVKFNVIEEPEMTLSDTCAYFTLTPLGDTTRRSVTIYNDGCQDLVISSMTSTSNQFKIYQSSATIPVGDSLVLEIDFIPTTVSNFTASIFIISNDTNRTICLNGQSGAMPVADFSFNDENICLGEIQFNNSASQYFNTLFWDFGDGSTSNQNNPLHSFATPGTYRVSLRASNSIGFDTISKLVTVNPLVVNFGISQDTLQLSDTAYFTDSTPNAVTWIWDFGDGTSSTQQNPSHHYTAQGIYNVKLTVIDNRSCSNTLTKQILVENRIALLEWQLQNTWSLYPNPSRGSFAIEINGSDWEDYQFEIIDAQGRVLHTLAGEKEPRLNFDLDLASGVYQLQVLQQGVYRDRKSFVIVD